MNIDEHLLDAARRVLDTKGLSDTVNAALTRAALATFDVRRFDATDEDIALSRGDRMSP